MKNWLLVVPAGAAEVLAMASEPIGYWGLAVAGTAPCTV